jgi:hypothetical protein
MTTVEPMMAAHAWRDHRTLVIDNTPDDVLRGMAFPYGDPVPEVFGAHVPPPPRPARRQPLARRPPRGIEDDIAIIQARIEALMNDVLVVQDVAPPPPPPARELAAFAADKQNVHTSQSVDMTKEVVARVLKIHVPEEYRWNMSTASKTVGEIIADCKLTLPEMVEMMNRYITDDSVYEMGKGIYGKVLDGVWQYVRNSPDKADMCRILKQELKDNIGMCAQGNLTRLCNVLSGYMDGIGPQESVNERLGRELPMLLDVEDRVDKAKTLMRSLNVPEAEWGPWLEAIA